jgi:hypothetical protein
LPDDRARPSAVPMAAVSRMDALLTDEIAIGLEPVAGVVGEDDFGAGDADPLGCVCDNNRAFDDAASYDAAALADEAVSIGAAIAGTTRAATVMTVQRVRRRVDWCVAGQRWRILILLEKPTRICADTAVIPAGSTNSKSG